MTAFLPCAVLSPLADSSWSQAWGGFDWGVATLFHRVQYLVYLLLLIGLVVSTIHLGLMLVTRWGDRRTSGKSFAFSAAIHGLLLVLALKVSFDTRAMPALPPRPLEEPVRVTTVTPFEGAEGQAREGFEGEQPWTRLPEFDRVIERPDRDMTADLSPLAPLERPELDLGPQPLNIPDAVLPAEESTQTPELARANVSPSAQPAAVPLELDTPNPEARPDMAAPETPRDRTMRAAAANPDPTPTRRPQRSRQRTRTRASFTPTLDLTPDPVARDESLERPPLARATPTDADRESLGPAPVQLPAENVSPLAVGEDTAAAPSRSQSPSRSRSRLTARSSRTPADGSPNVRPLARPRTSPGRRPVDSVPMANLPRLDAPPIEQPDLAAGGFDRTSRTPSSRLPAPYRNRAIDDRLETAQKYGGNASTEEAVERALRFMAASQSADGRWDASAFGAGTADDAADAIERPNTGRESDTGISGLCLLAFMGAGNTPSSGPYREEVQRGFEWLISQQRDDGYLGGLGKQQGAELIAGAYCHAIATFALAESVAMQEVSDVDPRQRAAIEKALAYSYSAQLPDGGWRYIPRQDKGGDMSIFGWHLMALKSAGYAGVRIPENVTADAITFLNERSIGPSRGLAGYRVGSPPTATMTAEALFCRQMIGVSRDAASSREAVAFVLRATPTLVNENFYYWYYGTLAMYQYGGEPWQQWNERLREILVSQQQPDGRWNAGAAWGAYGGDLYSTALGTLCLEVYYRYLPLYRQGGDLPE